MINITLPLYEELDPAKKDPEWGTLQVTLLRRYWRRLKNVEIAWANKATMYSVNEMEHVKNSFDDEDFKKSTKFWPLPILEPMLNSVVEEIQRNPPKSELKALDPSVVDMKKSDIEMLKHRGIVEGDQTELRSRVGIQDYKIPYDKFNGNVEQFDKMDLDESDPEDINFYEANLQRLNFEIAGQSIVNAVFKNSRFDKHIIRKLVKDIFALKAITGQKYVDKVTGEIKDKYIDPEEFYGIFGSTNSGWQQADVCKGWQSQVTVQEFLQMAGDQFDFERDWRYLLWGINFCNIRKFTGFVRNGTPFDCCGDQLWEGRLGIEGVDKENRELLDWSMAYLFKLYVGYIEWQSPEATSTFVTHPKKPNFADVVPYDFLLKPKMKKEGYVKESRYQFPWYGSYFIATTSVSQWLFGYGKVYLQPTTGANDEYCNGSLFYYQEEGLSATEIAQPYLQLANFTFYRMLWVIYKAKPDPDEFIFDELLQIARNTQRQFPQASTNGIAPPGIDNILMNIVKEQRAKHVRIRTYPRIDGKPVQQIHPIEQRGRGGIDPIGVAMQACVQWAEANISAKIGLNPIRLGENPPPRESTQTEENTVQYSMMTTGYIYRMIQFYREYSAVATLNYVQDIIKFKETLPYNWVKKIVGDRVFANLSALDNFAAHRCGIFFEDYNVQGAKQDIKAAANLALQNQDIDFPQWFLVTQTEDYKMAAMLLGRYKAKAAQAQQQAEMQKQQAASALEQQKFQNQLQLINAKGRWDLLGEQERTRSFVAGAEVTAKSRVDVKELQIASESPKIEAQAAAQMQIDKNKKDVEHQVPMPQPTPAPPPPTTNTKPPITPIPTTNEVPEELPE